MAESLADGEFWLPPKFLNDEDLFVERFGGNGVKSLRGGFGLNPFGFSPSGSPVESLFGETESDEDECIAGLTNRMARSALESNKSHGWGSLDSPQSTLCAAGNGCGCKQSSGKGSPNGFNPQLTLDLLCAAAGEVSKMRMYEEAYGFLNSPASFPLKNQESAAGVYQQFQASQFLHMRRQQILEEMKPKGSVRNHQPQMPQNRGRNSEFVNGGNRLTTTQPIWANSRKQAVNPPPGGSGMRAVFLGAPGGKRGSAGTGVFLPRQAGAAVQSRKKPACSTVLVPARVMQALNLNVDDMYVQRTQPQHLQSRSSSTFNSRKNDSSVRARRETFLPPQKANLRSPAPAPAFNHDVRLPQEWIY